MNEQTTVKINDYYARMEGLLSPAFHTKTILAVGCGAGSYLLETLARCSPRMLRLVDRDRVEAVNLARTSYRVGDIGKYKAAALGEHLKTINPFVQVQKVVSDICRLVDPALEKLCADVDLIVA